MLVPEGIGATCLVTASALEVLDWDRSVYLFTQRRQAGIAPGTSNVRLELPSPALPTEPADGATGVEATAELAWSAVPDAIYQVRVGGPRSYIIVSASPHARIPDLPQHWGVRPGTWYGWSVEALGPYPRGIDQFAGRRFVPGRDLADGTSRFLTLSNTSGFTTR